MDKNVQNSTKEDARIVRTKRDLANALEELLQEKNFDELSVKDITDRALISKNTFYNNFQDKNELLNFLFERYREQLLKDIQPYIDKRLECAVYPIRKIYFRVCLEKVIHSFYESHLPIDKMILADNSRSLFWNITQFIKNVLEDLDKKYDHFLTQKADNKISSYFFAGAFASTLYFSVLENNKLDEDKICKSLLKLAAPVIE